MSKDRMREVALCLVVLPTLWICADAQISRPSSANCHVTDGQFTHWGDIPLSFEPNVGQEPREVRYLARGSSYTLYLAGGEMLLGGHNEAPLRMKLLGANLAAPIVGEGQQDSTSNYFLGNDPSKWRTSVPNYGRARYRSVYPGIDLVYYGHDGNLEYDWIISPAADPQRIRLSFDGADQVRLDKQGDLVIKLGKSEYRHRKPVVYQEVAGKRSEIAGTWILRGKQAGFRIGAYDRGQPLVIDPVLYYSTYLGGNGLDYAYAIAVDKVGNTYVTGGTGSANFPTTNPLQSSLHGAEDVFVTKINANGSARLYSTYLGGGGPDEGKGIAVDSQGEVYVTGNAGSFDFPMMGAVQGTWGGSGDAFLTKLNATGSGLVYSTYLGGNAIDYATGIALDPAGNAYIVGVTFSTNFPTVNPYQSTKGAQQDAFVAKINPAGTAWVYATYLGGNNVDEGYAIAADADGNAYVTGYTASTNFPLQSPYRSSNGASVDAFVTKLNPAGSALVYSTYLGGSATDYGTGIAVDSTGSAYVTGVVGSSDFPVVNAMQPHLAGADDAFVTKFDPSGSTLVYSTYFGGGSEDQAYAVAIDQAGNAWITGRTNSSDFPLTNPIQATRFAFDMFITEINATGSASLFSTFLGGTGSESGRGIAVDSLGNIHIAGESTSTDFPVVNAVQMTNGGGAVSQDGIVLLLGNSPRLPYVFNDFAGKGCSDGELMYDASDGQSYTALSQGNGTYTYVPNLFTPGFDILRTGDFNGDGKADLILYNSHNALAYFGSGNGDGTFSFQALYWSPHYDFVETGDLNGDGKTDVVLYNSSTGNLVTGISNGDGTFTYSFHLVTSNLTYVRLADFTGDGKADLFLYGAGSGSAFLGVGDGNGGFTFNAVSLSPGYNLADVGDLNGDGKADLILYNSTNGNAATGISDGTGGFAFTPLIFSPGFTSVRLADYTGDGNVDVTLYNKINGTAYFGTGTGTGTFNFVVLFASPGFDWVIPEDVNCDGKVDVIFYNSTTGTEYTGISNGDGTFAYTYQYWGLGKVLVDQNHVSALPAAGSLVITASSASVVYGGVVPAITASYAGFVNGDTAASLTTPPTCTTTATSSSPVGIYPTTCSGAVDANYTISFVQGLLTITSAPLNIAANNTARAFGIANPPLNNVVASGFVNGDTLASLTGTLTCTTTATPASPAGSYPITCAGLSSPNYSITYLPGTLTIKSDTLTVTANNAARQYGSANPSFTVSFAGFVNGDTPASLGGSLACATTATQSSVVGTYPITCSGLSSPNYAITYVAGHLTITPPLCVASAIPAVSITRSGFSYSFISKRYAQTLTLTNTSGSPLSGPIYLVLDNLSSNASLYNSGGSTGCAAPLGSPYVSVAGTLNAGASTTLVLQFTDAANSAISYTTRVLSGAGQP